MICGNIEIFSVFYFKNKVHVDDDDDDVCLFDCSPSSNDRHKLFLVFFMLFFVFKELKQNLFCLNKT